MYLKKDDLKKVVRAAGLAARINELEHIAPYVPSDIIVRRKSRLKSQLKELTTSSTDKSEEPVINIKIELPEEERRDKKGYRFSLKDLFAKRVEELDDDADEAVVRVIRNLWPEEEVESIGKVITEL